VNLRWIHAAAFFGVIACWLAFAVAFLSHRKPPQQKAIRYERRSVVGIVIQGLAYAAIWMLERTRFTPIVPAPGPLAVILPLLAVALAVASLWMSLSALHTLGKEWSLEARVVEGHRLVTEGPYRLVRHPIYSAMLGMLLATGLVVSHWIGLLGGIVIFAIGTGIRVRSEERLLRAQFGAAYDDYARQVPAIIPRLTRR
jgi:protein-S-isoprenylcysteine O-methyltransferase Ste14